MLKIWLKRKHTADSIHCQLIKIEVKSITSLCRHFSLKIQSHHCTLYKEVFLKNQKIKKSQDNTCYLEWISWETDLILIICLQRKHQSTDGSTCTSCLANCDQINAKKYFFCKLPRKALILILIEANEAS